MSNQRMLGVRLALQRNDADEFGNHRGHQASM